MSGGKDYTKWIKEESKSVNTVRARKRSLKKKSKKKNDLPKRKTYKIDRPRKTRNARKLELSFLRREIRWRGRLLFTIIRQKETFNLPNRGRGLRTFLVYDLGGGERVKISPGGECGGWCKAGADEFPWRRKSKRPTSAQSRQGRRVRHIHQPVARGGSDQTSDSTQRSGKKLIFGSQRKRLFQSNKKSQREKIKQHKGDTQELQKGTQPPGRGNQLPYKKREREVLSTLKRKTARERAHLKESKETDSANSSRDEGRQWGERSLGG